MKAEMFKNPPPENRIKPFWFWNGEMDDKEIVRQISEMADKGVGGFFICPRQGLKIPYLSEAWFEKVKFAVETAGKYDLEVWLYDEYPYPSGISGGEVILRHPEAKHTTLEYKIVRTGGRRRIEMELPWAVVLSASAVPKDNGTGKYIYGKSIDLRNHIGNYQAKEVFQKAGLTAYNRKRYFTYGPQKMLQWDVPDGEWKIVVFLEKEIEDFKYYGTYVDPCCKEAVNTFIQTTHERYRDTIGEYFGGTVKGMFSDEVAPLGKIPWSNRLPEYFLKRNGYAIIQHLPALIDADYEDAAKIRYDLFQTMHLLFREAYHKQISDWCGENGIMLATEVPSARMTTQIYSHIPGGDSSHEKLGRSLEWAIELNCSNMRSNPKQVSSIARQTGRKFAMIECFHSVGWSMTLQDAKWMVDRMAALGINFYNFHAFFYTLDGLRKHDAPPSQFLQNPYWKHFRLLGDYVGRISHIMCEGKATTEIAVLDPTTTLWTHMGNPFHGFEYAGADDNESRKLEMLKKDWTYICKTLLMNQIDFDHMDAEILTSSIIENGKIIIGNAIYSVLILPPMTNIEAPAWEKIKAFSGSGGIVVAMGLLPYEKIDNDIKEEILEWFEVDSSCMADYWEGAGGHALNKEDCEKQWFAGKNNSYFHAGSGCLSNSRCGESLLALLERVAPGEYSLVPVKGTNHSFLMNTRKMPDGSDAVFIANHEGSEADMVLSANLMDADYCFEKLDLETGETVPVTPQTGNDSDSWKLPLHFDPYTSCMIRISKGNKNGNRDENLNKSRSKNSAPFVISLDASSDWRIRPEQKNILRFGSFEFMVGEDASKTDMPFETNGGKWPRVDAKTLIDQCSDLDGGMFNVNFRQSFGTPMKLTLSYPLKCWYGNHFYIEEMPSDAGIIMDQGAVSGEFAIYINGKPITKNDFKNEFIYDHNNQSCDIRKMLHKGLNSLVVRVTAEKDWDGLVDPIYIAGTFGVDFRSDRLPVLIQTPEISAIHGGVIKGFPYYSGTLSFKKQFVVESIPDNDEFELVFENWDNDFHDCAEVLINGVTLGARAWTPYVWHGKSSLLHWGLNDVEFKLTNTLIGMLDGKYFDYKTHTLWDVAASTR